MKAFDMFLAQGQPPKSILEQLRNTKEASTATPSALVVSNPALSMALALRTHNFRCFPVRKPKLDGSKSDGKVPAISGWPSHATTDAHQLKEWFANDDTNVGIATGDGLIVLDIDKHSPSADGEASLTALESVHGALPPTVTVSTPTGGRHLYFRVPAGVRISNCSGRLGPGLDVRGDGGYVVAPPSTHATGGEYKFVNGHSPMEMELHEMPAWLLTCLQSTTQPSIASVTSSASEFKPAANDVLVAAEKHVANYREKNPSSPGTGNQDAVIVGAILRNDWALTLEEALPIARRHNALTHNPRSEDELLECLTNGSTYAKGSFGAKRQEFEAALLELRAPVEFTAPEGTPQGDHERAIQRALTDIRERRGQTATRKLERLLKPAALLMTESAKPVIWRVDGLLPLESVGTIGGEPKTSKTWVLLDMAMAIANGLPAFGEFCTARAPVALFLLEDSTSSVRTRLRALAAGRNLDPVKACENVHVQCRGDLNLLDDRRLAEIVAEARLTNAQFIGIDPLRDAHTVEENSATEMAQVTTALRIIRDLTGACVVVVHHVSKAGKETSSRRPGQRMRGSSAFHGALDAGFYMGLKDSTPTTWENFVETEVKGARCAGSFGLTLSVEDDANGEAVKASWCFNREPTQAGMARADECAEKVSQALENAWRESPGAPKPLSTRELAATVRLRIADVSKALSRLCTAGQARQISKGKRSEGYIYLPGAEVQS